MRIYLITHAHTEQIFDIPAESWMLSPRGTLQAAELAMAHFWPEVNRIVVSSESKTWLTVTEIAVNRCLPVWVDCRFDEVRRSEWVEDYSRQVELFFTNPEESIGGWERAVDAQRRAMAGLQDLQERFAGETVALVGHGLCLSLVRAHLLSQPIVDFSHWQRLSFSSHASFSGQPLTLIDDFDLSSAGIR